MNNYRIATELLRVANLLCAFKYGHTLWVTPKGKVINLPSGSDTHYAYIAKNYAKLFPDEEFSDSNVYDIPFAKGWVRVRNHGSELNFYGTAESFKKTYSVLKDMVDERMDDGVFIDVNYEPLFGQGSHVRKSFRLPDDYDKVLNEIL